MITILNKNKMRGETSDAVYIGRQNRKHGLESSPLANPFRIGLDGSRAEVIEKYRRWLWKEMQNQRSAAYQELLRLARLSLSSQLKLLCYCSPLACHGSVIERAINYLNRELTRSYIDARVKKDPILFPVPVVAARTPAAALVWAAPVTLACVPPPPPEEVPRPVPEPVPVLPGLFSAIFRTLLHLTIFSAAPKERRPHTGVVIQLPCHPFAPPFATQD